MRSEEEIKRTLGVMMAMMGPLIHGSETETGRRREILKVKIQALQTICEALGWVCGSKYVPAEMRTSLMVEAVARNTPANMEKTCKNGSFVKTAEEFIRHFSEMAEGEEEQQKTVQKEMEKSIKEGRVPIVTEEDCKGAADVSIELDDDGKKIGRKEKGNGKEEEAPAAEVHYYAPSIDL